MEPVFAQLREERHLSTSVLGSSLLLSDFESGGIQNAQAIVQLFSSLGLFNQPEKSVLKSTQRIQNLGVIH